jgi:hypothetical protein
VNGWIYGMSADGRVAVGKFVGASPGSGAGLPPAIEEIDGDVNAAAAISGNGKTIVCSELHANGLRQGGNLAVREDLSTAGRFAGAAAGTDKVLSRGYGVSGDGSVVVGFSRKSNEAKSYAFPLDCADRDGRARRSD